MAAIESSTHESTPAAKAIVRADHSGTAKAPLTRLTLREIALGRYAVESTPPPSITVDVETRETGDGKWTARSPQLPWLEAIGAGTADEARTDWRGLAEGALTIPGAVDEIGGLPAASANSLKLDVPQDAEPLIEQSPAVLLGAARIRDRRISVRQIIAYRRLGATDQQIRESFQQPLSQRELGAALTWYFLHPADIDRELAEEANEMAEGA